MEKIFKRFNSNMSNGDFLDQIFYLDSLDDGTLCEYDDDNLSDFYNNLYSLCPKQIDLNINNNKLLPNRCETVGGFMSFLRMTNL